MRITSAKLSDETRFDRCWNAVCSLPMTSGKKRHVRRIAKECSERIEAKQRRAK